MLAWILTCLPNEERASARNPEPLEGLSSRPWWVRRTPQEFRAACWVYMMSRENPTSVQGWLLGLFLNRGKHSLDKGPISQKKRYFKIIVSAYYWATEFTQGSIWWWSNVLLYISVYFSFTFIFTLLSDKNEASIHFIRNFLYYNRNAKEIMS